MAVPNVNMAVLKHVRFTAMVPLDDLSTVLDIYLHYNAIYILGQSQIVLSVFRWRMDRATGCPSVGRGTGIYRQSYTSSMSSCYAFNQGHTIELILGCFICHRHPFSGGFGPHV